MKYVKCHECSKHLHEEKYVDEWLDCSKCEHNYCDECYESHACERPHFSEDPDYAYDCWRELKD